jgi:hypothetical protein
MSRNAQSQQLQQRIRSLQISAADRQRFARELERAEQLADSIVDMVGVGQGVATSLWRGLAGLVNRPRAHSSHGGPRHPAR